MALGANKKKKKLEKNPVPLSIRPYLQLTPRQTSEEKFKSVKKPITVATSLVFDYYFKYK